ncbi:uncharacterized protein LY89DRAFT_496240 [Mollisia scopiformis]|uniref:Uncharacterized protein n=1 Tax=Mollisia scopiformis TaxID=149040 RepID=A0A194XHB9_MOLSC|nr:uncharacterized protein LY89DRAFT_496240 [Mollisia scopiformis]KUJ19605.1 hypothetical protein LY89DRAFT_496240 [Mollisia scopiformis]
MGSPAAATPGTLAEYDIILSISEEAINRQFQILYDKKIDEKGGALPPPPGMEQDGVAPPPPSKYLINHELEIHLAEEGLSGQPEIDYESGIIGHTKCPKVSFKDSGTSNKGRISFEFERVETAKEPDSVFKYWVGKGKAAETRSQVINGYTMSWEVNLGQKNIQDIAGELLNPAESNSSPETLHPDAVKAITPLANEHFTIASIFCIFEAAQIADSFRLFDAESKPLPDVFHTSFMTKVAGYFSLLQRKIKPGRATPDHPFVLGYGLSQTLPTIPSRQPNAIPDSTPKFFIPRKYNVTVTPGQGSNFTAGTFNFCILTHRDENQPGRDPVRSDPSKNLNAGKLDKTFFDLTRTREHDGLMAFARDLIFDNFLCKEVANSFFIDIEAIFKKAMDKGSIDSSEYKTTPSMNLSSQPPSWSKKQTAELSGKIKRMLLDDKQNVTGFSKLDVSWQSDLQTNPNIEEKDARRHAQLIFTSQVKEDFDFVDVGFISDDKLFAHVDMIYKYVLNISPGTGGLVDITKDDKASSLPVRETSGKLKLIQAERKDGEYGAYFTTTKKTAALTDLWNNLKSVLPEQFQSFFVDVLDAMEKAWAVKIADTAIAEYENKWNAGITSIKNKVILPAGNVFNFSGVDVDSQGNMYTHVSFSNGGEKIKKTHGDLKSGDKPMVGGEKPTA